jgi:hypothetical protein
MTHHPSTPKQEISGPTCLLFVGVTAGALDKEDMFIRYSRYVGLEAYKLPYRIGN